jgi:hypothetical protein
MPSGKQLYSVMGLTKRYGCKPILQREYLLNAEECRNSLVPSLARRSIADPTRHVGMEGGSPANLAMMHIARPRIQQRARMPDYAKGRES